MCSPLIVYSLFFCLRQPADQQLGAADCFDADAGVFRNDCAVLRNCDPVYPVQPDASGVVYGVYRLNDDGDPADLLIVGVLDAERENPADDRTGEDQKYHRDHHEQDDVAEAYPVFPDFQLDLLVTFHAEELLSAVTSALVQEEVLPL